MFNIPSIATLKRSIVRQNLLDLYPNQDYLLVDLPYLTAALVQDCAHGTYIISRLDIDYFAPAPLGPDCLDDWYWLKHLPSGVKVISQDEAEQYLAFNINSDCVSHKIQDHNLIFDIPDQNINISLQNGMLNNSQIISSILHLRGLGKDMCIGKSCLVVNDKQYCLHLLNNQWLSKSAQLKLSDAGIKTTYKPYRFTFNFCKEAFHKSVKDQVLQDIVKNDQAIKDLEKAHINESVAAIKTMSAITCLLKDNQEVYERDIVHMLESCRMRNPDYLQPAFPTICGYACNSSLPHYYAAAYSPGAQILPDNLLMLDWGGQYLYATTDATRMFYWGNPNQEIKHLYTVVLQAHLISLLSYIPGCSAKYLQALSLDYLASLRLDCPHSTYHGVGRMLNVHEKVPPTLVPGTVLTREPGVYQAGRFGIRIENMDLIEATDSGSSAIRTLTMFPYDVKLIEFSMLNRAQTDYIRAYNMHCYDQLQEHLNSAQKEFLKQMI